jgi:4-alpha-glucanotransferase
MLTVFPIQDLVGIDGKLRRKNPASEQINNPANPEHYWRYRFHMNMEDLLKCDDLNANLAKLITESGRNSAN